MANLLRLLFSRGLSLTSKTTTAEKYQIRDRYLYALMELTDMRAWSNTLSKVFRTPWWTRLYYIQDYRTVKNSNRHPIISRTLNEHELNYIAIEIELLPIIWPTKTFRYYLVGKFYLENFWLLVTINLLDGCIWVNAKLQIDYIRGKAYSVADELPRN